MYHSSLHPTVLSVCAHLLSHVQLCDLMDYSLPGSSVHGIFQARILEWVPFPPSGDFPDPGIKPTSSASPALAHGYLPSDPLGKHFCPSHILVKHGRTDKV